ncbi:DUF6612 family protein [Fictibacillus gelatini]|uniref:DUF6612 family protein n=1 Tax=Fictibacillus gelatini TaxID=225985 RepID=UPI00040B36C2|nr:DUF6612 family protein [Fictibacillus gelatini]
MLKRAVIAGVFSMGLILSGCGQKAEQSSGGAKEQKVTAEQVLEKTTKASANIKNYEMDADMNVEMNAEGHTMKMPTKINAQMATEPLLVHQKMDTEDKGQPVSVEMYITKDEAYMNQGGQWIKMPNQGPMDLSKATENMSPAKKMEQMKKFVKDLSLKDKGDTYELKMSGKGDEIKEFAKEMMAQNMNPQSAQAIEQSLNNMKISDLKYTLTIDKKTNYPKQLLLDMNMEIKEGSHTAEMKLHMDSTMSKFNKVKDLAIPENVKKAAKEVKTQ